MEKRKNPFHELYVTESISSDKFVHLFSPFLVDKSLALFQPGHIILKGLPGTGKSMLLSLFKTSVRKEYIKNKIPFPVPPEFSEFIGAGINLKRSGVSDFGQRPVDSKTGYEESPFYFADFLNYWVVLDILESVESLSSPDSGLAQAIGIDANPKLLHDFVVALARNHCWNNFLDGVESFEDLKKRLSERIRTYRSYLNYNLDTIPEGIKNTKTTIGEPISVCAQLLRSSGVIKDNTEVYVRIDQYEELAWLEESPNYSGKSYQEMIRKLLGLRDSRVSYRIGTRHFAWQDGGKMFGTSARLEKGRNYIDISIDAVLKRRENPRTWIFPDFAEDILKRRIDLSKLEYNNRRKSVLEVVFGKSGLPTQKANDYVKSDKTKAIRLEEDWPKKWQSFLRKLAEQDPLSARLGEAWARQRGPSKKEVMTKIPKTGPYPWDKQWWRKERIEQALLQIASRNNQQIQWYGKDDILSLSGGNILAFLSLCRHIWDVWIRDTYKENFNNKLLKIDKQIQSIGIVEASSSWYDDITLEKGGRERKLFIQYLGTIFYKTLVEDIAMSNPGNNGFSIGIEDLANCPEVLTFLNEATDYGDLYDAPHTSKLKDKKGRRKWYLHPVLSPHFKIPSIHTKEPIYVSAKEVGRWISESIKGDGNFNTKKLTDDSDKGSGQIKIEF
jgi:hypothetical protein